MDYLSHNVSENLKRIRQSKGMSLDQVAEQVYEKDCFVGLIVFDEFL